MANLNDRRPENIEGEFYVDTSCIDCDVCRWMAPSTFARRGGQSAVHAQPRSSEESSAALRALVSCPTSSIGTVSKQAMKSITDSFPISIDANVFHCGYHEESSFGAASYFIRREQGNVLIDSPRFAGPLVRRLEELGGIDVLFLTHRDDVGDHEKFREHFGCRRVMHRDDASGSLLNLEQLLDISEPTDLDEELCVIPLPGHTRGSCALLYQNRYLFSGDHVAWSHTLEQIYAFRSACWYDWEKQIASMRALALHSFEWILPGHGRRCKFPADQMKHEIQRCIDWM